MAKAMELNRYYRQHRVVNSDLQAARFGGLHWGAAFYGWLVAIGIGVILTALLSAAGAAFAVTSLNGAANSVQGALSSSGNDIQTISIVGGILLLAVMAIAYYAGGYVAGRMGRFSGLKQGFGVWVISLVLAILLAVAGSLFGAKYNVLQQLNLPHIPVDAGSFTTGGIIASVLALLVSLGAALLGGKTGEAYHRRIDEAGFVEE